MTITQLLEAAGERVGTPESSYKLARLRAEWETIQADHGGRRADDPLRLAASLQSSQQLLAGIDAVVRADPRPQHSAR
ncbi:hypothetical protein P5V34_04985 [Mycobacteroides abscessus subsp. abscessus]|jgi:hypothetical protein|uniref:hypothetical protein n=1 Tax=Mycobacteroides abscessus TaxID=36809 RepID=UPI00266BC459|nr:hypothetical protein [Mycobacteroides abscessus]MDO3013339.1 hypothetical protein [Mycobacteroides abscessus subsp. abscessus]